jgi:hypothetical protein
MKWNLKQASLLDASGELSGPARQKLLEKIKNDPSANAEYETAQQNFAIFDYLPFPEPSAAQRLFIPRMLKSAIHSALRQHEQAAFRTRVLIRCAAVLLIVAAGITLFASLAGSDHAQDARQREQIAKLNLMIERVTASSDSTSGSAYNQAVTDVEASIRQLQTESPTLSYLHSSDLGNLFDALAAVPEEGETGDFGPPGSF